MWVNPVISNVCHRLCYALNFFFVKSIYNITLLDLQIKQAQKQLAVLDKTAGKEAKRERPQYDRGHITKRRRRHNHYYAPVPTPATGHIFIYQHG